MTSKTALSGAGRWFANPLVFGIASGIAVALFDLLVPLMAKGSFDEGVPRFLDNGMFALLVPAAVAVQMGLFRHYRNITRTTKVYGLEKIGVSGSAVSVAGMVACCVCCIPPLSIMLTAAGLSIMDTSVFIEQYQAPMIIAGLSINAIGILIMLLAIERHRKRPSPGGDSF
jgi:hypothetical protein